MQEIWTHASIMLLQELKKQVLHGLQDFFSQD